MRSTETVTKTRLAEVGLTQTRQVWIDQVYHALRNLGDRSVLNRSQLSRRSCVERIANESFKGRTMPRGAALRHVLEECVDRIVTELGDEPGLSKACQYLQLLRSGLSCREIGKEMGMSREHASRYYRPKALELVTAMFLATTGHEELV